MCRLVAASALFWAAGCVEDPLAHAPAVLGAREQTYPNGHPLSTASGDAPALSVEEEVARLTNDHRVSLGLPALVHAGEVRDVARAHARHMIVHDFFAHTNPEGDGPGGRLTAAGAAWRETGENLAGGYGSAGEAFAAWLASPGHRSNVEDPDWTHLGCGYAADPGDGGAVVYVRYYAQQFVRRP